jgi:hypothetical protein
MPHRVVLAGRAALGLAVLYAVARVLDPEARWAAGVLPADRVEHALTVFVLLLAALCAFPRLRLRVAVAAMLVVGVAVEAVQALPGAPGGFQLADLGADLAGVLLAAGAFAAGRTRRA